MKLKIKKRKIIIILMLVIILVPFCIWQNNSITVTELSYKNDKIPKEFNGYKILQISDFHGKEFGKAQNRILSKVKDINPDIIVITGDLIDSRRGGMDKAMDLVKGIVLEAPVYYVSGNHEARTDYYEDLKAKLKQAGVTVLDNDKTKITVDGSTIDLLGLSDPMFDKTDYMDYSAGASTYNKLKDLCSDSSSFKILLSHRPELLDTYAESNVDLVFSGHAHGGQIRLPLIGGLVAPGQGLFPKLTEGMNKKDNTTMVISRGLGNSIIPQRLFNRPELVVVKLNK